MISDQRYLTNTVKFIAALLVVNGHTFMYYSGMPDISRWINIGAQCVSLFLFLSAYGLMCAYQQKGDKYLQGFLTRRLGRILLPLLTAYAIALPVFEIFRGAVDWTDVLLTLYWGGLYLKFSWYVTEILVLYLLFYSCAKLSKSPKQLMHMLTFAVIALMAVMIATQQPLWYINGLPCFIFGLWYQHYEEKILAVSDKGKWLLIIAMAVIFLFLFQWRFIRDAVPALSAYRYEYAAIYLSNVFFVCLIVCLLTAHNVHKHSFVPSTPPHSGNSLVINSFYEIYLIQNPVMLIVTSFALPFGWTWFLIMLGTIVMGVLMNRINNSVLSHI